MVDMYFDILLIRIVQGNNSFLPDCIKPLSKPMLSYNRARHIPLADSMGQVKLPVGQVDLGRLFFEITYNLNWKMHNLGSQSIEIF